MFIILVFSMTYTLTKSNGTSNPNKPNNLEKTVDEERIPFIEARRRAYRRWNKKEEIHPAMFRIVREGDYIKEIYDITYKNGKVMLVKNHKENF